jgi:hypothetical protein
MKARPVKPARKPGSHPASKPRAAGTLKAATLALVEAAAGPGSAMERAAELAEVARSTVQRWTDPDGECAAITIPAGKVRALEAAAGDPIVTRFLAHEAGCALVPLTLGDEDALAVLTGLAAGQSGRVFERIARGLADGRLDPREAAEAKGQVDQALAAFARLRALLDALDGDGP